MLSKFDFASPILSKFNKQDRVYELINELTEQADHGFSQSVKFYGQNARDVTEYIENDGEGRELHCELTLETKGLLENQDLIMGVLYSKTDEEVDSYSFDGLMITFNYQHANAPMADFAMQDVHSLYSMPQIYESGPDS